MTKKELRKSIRSMCDDLSEEWSITEPIDKFKLIAVLVTLCIPVIAGFGALIDKLL